MIEEVRGEYQFRIKVRSPRYAREMLREWRESLPGKPEPRAKQSTGFLVETESEID